MQFSIKNSSKFYAPFIWELVYTNYLTYLSIFHWRNKIFFSWSVQRILNFYQSKVFFAYFTIIKLSSVSKMSITRIIFRLIQETVLNKKREKNVKKQRRYKFCTFNIAECLFVELEKIVFEWNKTYDVFFLKRVLFIRIDQSGDKSTKDIELTWIRIFRIYAFLKIQL